MDKLRENTMWTFWTAVREALGAGAYSEYEELKAVQFADHYEDIEYHGLGHIRSIIEGLKRFDIPGRERALMTIAAWFHDYSPDSDASLFQAETFMQERGFSDEDIAFVRYMIVSTEWGAVPQKDKHIALRQAQFRDVDWSILGQPPSVYNRYVALVETEYSHIPCDVFRNGRIEFLSEFVNRKPLFWTPEMEEEYGDQARRNMARELRWRYVNDS